MMNDASSTHIGELIRKGESLTVEFKSDTRSLPDRDLVAAVVVLANTEGGDLLLGVEDDGQITGLHPNYQNLSGLAALIANKTNPPLSVRVEAVETKQGTIARIMVQKSRQLVSTSEGVLLRRRLMANGKPEAVPFYPHEFIQRQSAMGLTDPSALLMKELSVDDLNPLERHRLREAIRKYGGDQSLLPLADEELEGALGFTMVSEGVRCPTLAGLLLRGREEQLRRFIPAYETAFQVLEGHGCPSERVLPQAIVTDFRGDRAAFPGSCQRERNSGRFVSGACPQLRPACVSRSLRQRPRASGLFTSWCSARPAR